MQCFQQLRGRSCFLHVYGTESSHLCSQERCENRCATRWQHQRWRLACAPMPLAPDCEDLESCKLLAEVEVPNVCVAVLYQLLVDLLLKQVGGRSAPPQRRMQQPGPSCCAMFLNPPHELDSGPVIASRLKYVGILLPSREGILQTQPQNPSVLVSGRRPSTLLFVITLMITLQSSRASLLLFSAA
jgi:hypothetical protein